MRFLQKIKRELTHNGLSSLLKSGPQFLRKQLRGLPYLYLRNQALEHGELRSYCRNHGACWEYAGACRVEITPDVQAGTVPEQFLHMVGNYRVSSSYVFELSEAKLLGEHAAAVTATGDPVLESTRGRYAKLHNAIAEPSFPRWEAIDATPERCESRVNRCVFPLVLPKSSFFVWIVEFLPKLRAWEHYVRQTGTRPAVVLWTDAPSWMRESLELLGVEEIIQEPINVLQPDRLVLGTHRYHNVGIDYNPHCPEEYNWLGERIRASVTSSGGSEKVYISRTDASRRQVTNESELAAALDSYGFERVTLAEKPFADQVRTVTEANVILSLHGAGLAHMLWSDDPTVIEIVPDTYSRPTFFCLSQILGLNYIPVIGETVNHSVLPKERDVRVDIEQVENVLSRIEH